MHWRASGVVWLTVRDGERGWSGGVEANYPFVRCYAVVQSCGKGIFWRKAVRGCNHDHWNALCDIAYKI